MIMTWIILGSCQFKSQEQKVWEEYAKNELLSRIGKIIYLPDSILIVEESVISTFDLNQRKSKRKLVTYIDISCSACLSNFSFWNQFMKESDEQKIECEYLIFINGKINSLNAIRKLGFDYPVLLDSNSIFIEMNQLWDKRFQTALLNERNEVILMGDPTVNEKLKDL
jgi:hypothetical protein